MIRRLASVLALTLVGGFAAGHDIWVEPNVNLVRLGEPISLALMLGNHGNTHRDFRLANKVGAGDRSLWLIAPDGSRRNLTPSLVDNGYAPEEGFWSARFTPSAPGLYLAASTMDKVMSYAPVRDVKSAKTFFVASPTLDRVPARNPGFDRVLGHALELVPIVNPVTPFQSGSELRVRLLYKGKPLAKSKVSFIPRGAKLSGEVDSRFERMTDANGEASLPLREANAYLVAAHHADDQAKGKGYESVHYSATLCLVVPGVCPCDAE
ncbi:MAG: DUF4198 domain-containing protein [Fimbriimonas sp.]